MVYNLVNETISMLESFHMAAEYTSKSKHFLLIMLCGLQFEGNVYKCRV